ncbi:hypothetical protein [Streptomyces sp. NPDC008001]|uniref:hypothetical protein n=1 Tax=Streptomyces sp. NPDC008001 TaxID=3364804 RepID=UPI0036EDF184
MAMALFANGRGQVLHRGNGPLGIGSSVDDLQRRSRRKPLRADICLRPSRFCSTQSHHSAALEQAYARKPADLLLCVVGWGCFGVRTP